MLLRNSRLNPLGCLLLIAAAMPICTAARADVIDFNDLGPSTIGVHMPATYNNLRWGTSDWHYLTSVSDPAETFLALSGTATFVGVITGGDDFYFDGADFWSRRGLDANGDFYFVLYHDGVTVYNGRVDNDGRQRFDGTHQLLAPSYTGPIDGFALAFDSGPDHWNHLAMDNIRIRPIPCTRLCPADVNCSGTLSVQDIFDFLGSYFAQDVAGDFNASGTTTVQDIFDFLASYFAGC